MKKNIKSLSMIFLLAAIIAGFDHAENLHAAGIEKTGDIKLIGGIELVFIKGGTFLMGTDEHESPRKKETANPYRGSEHPRHKVTVGSFRIGKYEITQKQFHGIKGDRRGYYEGDDQPVENVGWEVAKAFCASFGRKFGVKARLPYEAEWEYACRAGSTSKYYWGDRMDGDFCWYRSNANRPHPVGQKKPNAWGLYDMSGNVWEWCEDWYADYPEGDQVNPRGPQEGQAKIIRGGGIGQEADIMRSACRGRLGPNWWGGSIGFRIVVEVK